MRRSVNVLSRPSNCAQILSSSAPVAMGYVPLGTVFGFLLVQAGGPWWTAPLASLLVFAGAAQFMALPMLAAGAPIGALALATLVVNLRHIFYGLSLLNMMPRHRLARGYLIWALTDENYALITTMPAGTSAGRMVAVAGLNHFWWVLGSTLGALLGLQAPNAVQGVEFSLSALFAVLAVEQWRATRRVGPMLIALAAYAGARLLAPEQALLLAIAFSLGAGLLWRGAAND